MEHIKINQSNQNQNIDTITANPSCKHCNSNAVVKYGYYKDVPRYWCKACNRKFKGDSTLFHMKVPPGQISSALSMYYSGMSINEIRTHFKQENGSYPSSKAVYGWITKYTDIAIAQTKDYCPNVGDTWIADETVLKIDGQNVWMYDIIDSDTRYLLATRITTKRTIHDAQMLMESASKKANGKIPKVVITDSNNSYLMGIDNAFGGDTQHKQGNPFDIENNTNLIERFHGTLKERTKVMRGLKSVESAQKFVDGWLVHYNYFKPHISLEGKTPADVSEIDYQHKNWSEIIRQPVSKESEKQTHSPIRITTVKTRIKLGETHVGRPHKIRTPSITPKVPRITPRTPRLGGVFTNKQGSILSNHSFRGSRRVL